ncbi:MAG TPA: hypothetical protein VLM89_07360, partial [Phycisphaerae bacterium]|nr:hypothetical protein [Phycisphaerae bacterium]
YRKYQWIEVRARKCGGRDARKESYRPDCESICTRGEPIHPRRGDWSERAKYVLAKASASMEDLYDQQARDRTSLGIFRPKVVHDLIITPDDPEWKAGFKAELAQARLWDDRKASREPPRKVPFKFQYRFECDDHRCKSHRMMIEDWEVGALYWKLVDKGKSPQEAADQVKARFLHQLCGKDKDARFYVGTILAHPKTWLVIGVFYPTIKKTGSKHSADPMLFD